MLSRILWQWVRYMTMKVVSWGRDQYRENIIYMYIVYTHTHTLQTDVFPYLVLGNILQDFKFVDVGKRW